MAKVTWAGEAKKFYEKNKGKNGIHSFSDALKSPELKKQYKLALKKGGSNEEPLVEEPVIEEPVKMDGGEEPVVEEPLVEESVMDGGEEPVKMDGGKRKKSTKKGKKTTKKSKTAKKQRKYRK